MSRIKSRLGSRLPCKKTYFNVSTWSLLLMCVFRLSVVDIVSRLLGTCSYMYSLCTETDMEYPHWKRAGAFQYGDGGRERVPFQPKR